MQLAALEMLVLIAIGRTLMLDVTDGTHVLHANSQVEKLILNVIGDAGNTDNGYNRH